MASDCTQFCQDRLAGTRIAVTNALQKCVNYYLLQCGDKPVIEGAYFLDFRPEKDGSPWHVTSEMPTIEGIPVSRHPSVSVYRGLDWGYHPDPAVCLWIAVLPDRRAIAFKEMTWKQTVAADVAGAIKRESEGMRVIETFCDPTMIIQTGASPYTIGDIFEQHGVPLTPSTNKREVYGYAIHNYLNTIINGLPQLQIVSGQGRMGCPKLIQTFPTLRIGHPDPNKIADGNDHWVIALAYFCMGGAASPQMSHAPEVPKWMRPKMRPGYQVGM